MTFFLHSFFLLIPFFVCISTPTNIHMHVCHSIENAIIEMLLHLITLSLFACARALIEFKIKSNRIHFNPIQSNRNEISAGHSPKWFQLNHSRLIKRLLFTWKHSLFFFLIFIQVFRMHLNKVHWNSDLDILHLNIGFEWATRDLFSISVSINSAMDLQIKHIVYTSNVNLWNSFAWCIPSIHMKNPCDNTSQSTFAYLFKLD